jgi:hypothetical protein
VPGGAGGGYIRIKCGGDVTLGDNGKISACGGAGDVTTDNVCGSGGGAGGTFYIEADNFFGDPSKTKPLLKGGDGGVHQQHWGGGGAGGRKIEDIEGTNQFQGSGDVGFGEPGGITGVEWECKMVEVYVFFPFGPYDLGYHTPNSEALNDASLFHLKNYLTNNGFTKCGDVWYKNVAGKRTQVYVFHHDYRELDGDEEKRIAEKGRAELQRALQSLGSYVVYNGHSNFGLGPSFANKPYFFKQGKDEVGVGINALWDEGFCDWDGSRLTEADFAKGDKGRWKDIIRVAWDPRGPLTVPPTVLKGDVDVRGACFECYYMSGCTTYIHFLETVKKHNSGAVILYTTRHCAAIKSPKNFVKGVVEGTSWVDIIEAINDDERYYPPNPPTPEVRGAGQVDGYNKNKARE